MPKAEIGSTKWLGNKMKAKGLQRLRWYCQVCGKQCRDENGFKQHTLSEGHVRAMHLVGEDPSKYINDYSNQFKRDFLQLLKTAHGEKKIHINVFYQEYIREKEHVHMNATKWSSLTEFAKYLGKEGLCRVEEAERGLEIAFVDDSPEALRRREDIKRREMMVRGDEEMAAKAMERQIKKAGEEQEAREERERSERKERTGHEPEVKAGPIRISLAPKAVAKAPPAPNESGSETASLELSADTTASASTTDSGTRAPDTAQKLSFSLAAKAKSKTSNPLARKNPLMKKRVIAPVEEEKKMTNVERIMREELESKRLRESRGFDAYKRQRLG